MAYHQEITTPDDVRDDDNKIDIKDKFRTITSRTGRGIFDSDLLALDSLNMPVGKTIAQIRAEKEKKRLASKNRTIPKLEGKIKVGGFCLTIDVLDQFEEDGNAIYIFDDFTFGMNNCTKQQIKTIKSDKIWQLYVIDIYDKVNRYRGLSKVVNYHHERNNASFHTLLRGVKNRIMTLLKG